MKAIIDVGTLLVHAALAAQKTTVVVTHKRTGIEKEFGSQTEFWGHWKKKDSGWLAQTNASRVEKGLKPFSVDEFEIRQETTLLNDPTISPETLVCGRFKNKIESIISQSWCDDFVICFGTGENFRYAVAQTQPYKAGRPDKPLLLEYVKDYALRKYKKNVFVCDGIEDDDAVTAFLWNDWNKSKGSAELSVVGVHIDKDILQAPGWHFNFDKPDDGLEFINLKKAHKHFAKQLLIGDNCDNIPGIREIPKTIYEKYCIRKTKGVGEKTADALLTGELDIPEIYSRVVECYKGCYGEDKQPFTTFRGDVLQWNWLDHLDERFQLLRLREDVDKPVGHVSEFLYNVGCIYE